VNTPVLGPAIAIWTVGYLIQFGIFMAVARKSSGNSVVGWLLASMTLRADWTVIAPWSPAAVLVVVGAYAASTPGWYAVMICSTTEFRRPVQYWKSKPVMNMIINSVYIRRTMTLRIERSDGTPAYEASATVMLGEIPGPGDVLLTGGSPGSDALPDDRGCTIIRFPDTARADMGTAERSDDRRAACSARGMRCGALTTKSSRPPSSEGTG
jgi:hypothetical protein